MGDRSGCRERDYWERRGPMIGCCIHATFSYPACDACVPHGSDAYHGGLHAEDCCVDGDDAAGDFGLDDRDDSFDFHDDGDFHDDVHDGAHENDQQFYSEPIAISGSVWRILGRHQPDPSKTKDMALLYSVGLLQSYGGD